ncbi:hypothetical protein H6501_03635 [Candidatus Woesearchaeota archaeon]|nr:hypothetical protein [Nanoarchaeota archaeon]MCB9370662.1 hypothetical protein [Candidatus Woesearchaeota archaeon]USN43746.1 MAG: hypothetical protein H6500_05135 [Candidatus Woesearchaeota archaeon]
MLEVVFFFLLVLMLPLLFSSFTLYLSVLLLRGRNDFLSCLGVTLLLELLTLFFLLFSIPYPFLVLFLILAWLYHKVFRLSWLKVFLIFFVQLLVTLFFLFLLAFFGSDFSSLSFLLTSYKGFFL